MSKPKLYVLVGLPASGKSTWAKTWCGNKSYNKFDVILSSDDYREKICGDVNDQTKNQEVFKHLHTDMVTLLKEGKSVCIDATNITRKSRNNIFSLIEFNKIDCEVIAVVFATSIEKILERNKHRSRVVPENVIFRMMGNFELPFEGEGFNSIRYVENLDEDTTVDSIVKKMKGFNQNNFHHTATLDEHCKLCCENITQAVYGKGDFYNKLPLILAAKLHDIGKLYTQTYDEEKNICHYYGHEGAGAYIFLTTAYLESDYKLELKNRVKTAFYINYHMEPFRLKDAKPITKEKYISQFGKEWDNILLLHEADINAK